MTEPLTYTVEQAGRLLGVSRGTAYAAARDGSLPTVRICRRLLVPRCQLERMLGVESAQNGEDPATNGALAKPSDHGALNDPAYSRP
jgi:excisionase family DNA binding protein